MSRATSLALLSALALTVSAAQAADEGRVLRQQAEHLAGEDRCDEAVERARRARSLDPGDARAALVEGRCLLRAGDYDTALAPLREARELDPSLPGVSTDLVQALYHLDRIPEAREELARAEAQNPDDARLALYKGLVLLRDAESAEAAASFDRAASLDPRLSDTASLYAGRTWASLDERDRAAEALERAREADPDSEWGRAAARELDELEELRRRRTWLRVKGGLEYDSNVPLLADLSQNQLSQSEFGPLDSPEEDMRGIFEAEAGLELWRTQDWSTGVVVGYDGNAHAELNDDKVDTGDFDLSAPWGSFWLDRRLCGDTWLRFQPYGGFTWLGYEPFVLYGGMDSEISTRFSERWGGRVIANVIVNDFQFRGQKTELGNTAAENALENQVRRGRNRDGVAAQSGPEVTHDLALTGTYLRLGSVYERYWAEGRDWDYDGSRTWLGLVQPLPLRFRFEVLGRFSYLVFDHASSFHRDFYTGGAPRRRDQLWQVETELAHRLTPWLEIAAHYRYDHQNSNTAVYDYDRHIAGGTFTFFFGHY